MNYIEKQNAIIEDFSLFDDWMEKYELIIVCDDGSQDMTSEIAKKCGTELIKHKKNKTEDG